MNQNNENIITWILEKIKTEYPEDIALLLIYGSYVNGTANELSDVDFYFIPKTERGNALSKTFIINGIGYDLFPMSWERVKGISEFKEPLSPLLGNVRIEYYHTEQDLLQFRQHQQKLQAHLADEKYMREIATRNLDKAMSQYTKMLLTPNYKTARTGSGEILLLLSDAVAYLNQTYFRNGLKKQLPDLESMSLKPEGYTDLYKAVIEAKTIETIHQQSLKILQVTSQWLEMCSPINTRPRSRNYNDLKCVYEELLSTWNKVKICCQEGNKELAFVSGNSLQSVFTWVSEDYDIPAYDIMSSYDPEDLLSFENKAEAIRLEVVAFLEEQGLELKDYPTFDEFKEAQ